MLQLRDSQANLRPIEFGEFIEVTDSDGNLYRVIYRNRDGSVTDAGPGDHRLSLYARQMGRKLTRVLEFPETG